MPDAAQTVEIINKKGLHARASSKFARLASTFSSQITVSHEGETAIGVYIMAVSYTHLTLPTIYSV